MKSALFKFRGIPYCLVMIGILQMWTPVLRSQMASAQALKMGRSPIAVDSLPTGDLVILDLGGAMLLYSQDGGQVRLLKDTLGRYKPVDLAVARLGNQDLIFVTMFWGISIGNTQTNLGLLVEYSMQGKELRTWQFSNRVVGGIAIDPKTHVAYLGDAASAEILTLNLDADKNKTASFFSGISGVSRLGPLVLDTAEQRLFAADVGGGKVFALDLQKRKSRPLVAELGEPAALAYDSSLRQLYVADAAKHCIWVIEVNSASPRARLFSGDPKLREPRGVALAPGHGIWVADYGASALFALSPDGKVVHSVR